MTRVLTLIESTYGNAIMDDQLLPRLTWLQNQQRYLQTAAGIQTASLSVRDFTLIGMRWTVCVLFGPDWACICSVRASKWSPPPLQTIYFQFVLLSCKQENLICDQWILWHAAAKHRGPLSLFMIVHVIFRYWCCWGLCFDDGLDRDDEHRFWISEPAFFYLHWSNKETQKQNQITRNGHNTDKEFGNSIWQSVVKLVQWLSNISNVPEWKI